MPILDGSLAILRRAEELVIGRTFNVSPGFWRDAVDTLLHGPWFVISGFKAIGLVAIRCLAAMAGIAVLLSIVSFLDDGPAASSQGLWWAALVLGIGAVLLGLPSSIDARAVKESDVTAVADLIATKASDSVVGSALRQGVEVIQITTVRRIVAVRWALGIFWALLVWAASKALDADVSQEMRSGAFSYSLVGAVFFVFAGAVVAAYQMAHNRVSQTIVFAFLEFEASQRR